MAQYSRIDIPTATTSPESDSLIEDDNSIVTFVPIDSTESAIAKADDDGGTTSTHANPQPTRTQSSSNLPNDCNDGVFANLSAKPEVLSKSESLPAYESIAADSAPAYNVAVFVGQEASSSGTGDDMIVDGSPVGSASGFLASFILAFTLQIVGFILCYWFGQTHSSKAGARAGLGLLMIRESLRLSSISSNTYDDIQGAENSRFPSSDSSSSSGIDMIS